MPELLKYLPKAPCLIEPFAGGGSVFMNTNYNSYILCDSNPALINFFNVTKLYTDELIAAAKGLFTGGNNADDYYAIRKGFNFLSKWPVLAREKIRLAAAFLYLNRHCYNGIYRTNTDGKFNVPFNKMKKPYFPEQEIRQFAEKAWQSHARFECCDFSDALDLRIFPELCNAAIYRDPPYIPASDTADFCHYNGKRFTLDDHATLVLCLTGIHRKTGAHVVISNSDTPETREIYAPFTLHSIGVQRSIGAASASRKKAREVIGVLEGMPC
ncbi:Dam family site-specific DNA-(adenine-N6)-methyltransferase [Salmonella enterica]